MKCYYDIGLDIGVGSVGWATIDDEFNIIRYKKQIMSGSRLFDEGETAEARRIYRTNTRRGNRRKERLKTLKMLLGEDVKKVDKMFLKRLDESFLHLEDRSDKKNKSNLFISKEYSDKDYYKEYPTIYHLRKDLIESTDKKDIRLVYLAIHNILKYRGHFLYEGQSFDSITGDIIEVIQELINEINKIETLDIKINANEIKAVILDNSISSKKKSEILMDKVGIKGKKKLTSEEKLLKNILKGIVGLTIDVSEMFSDIDIDEELNKFKFSDEDIEDKLDELEEITETHIINVMRKIYSKSVVDNILKGEDYISFGKVKSYETYKRELKMLKKIISHYDKDAYSEIFKEKAKNKGDVNYEVYVKKGRSNDEVRVKFYNKIKGFINLYNTEKDFEEDTKYILNKIELDDFLVKQNTRDNSSIAYQLNEQELVKILENQAKHYESIAKNKDKIIQVLRFRVPYYVGPLNERSEFAWVKKKEGMKNKKIYPWNFEEIIDIESTATEFIKRMTNKCTYLTKEDVLPRNSLLFNEYMYYNEINRITINGKRLNQEEKEDLKEKLFLKKKSVSEKDIATWYKNRYLAVGSCKVEGLQDDKKAATSLASYIDFNNIFKEINSTNIDTIETIIEWLTIFTDQEILKRKIKNEYPEIYDDKEKLNKILKLKYKGWGRLSKKLLDGIESIDINSKTDEKVTIINVLRNTNLNFMQIINHKKYKFSDEIIKESIIDKIDEITYDNLIKNIQGSPKIKRGIWQSIQIVEEIIQVMGKKPRNIFIEFAREDQNSGRTVTSKTQLKKIYEGLDDSYLDVLDKKELNKESTKIDNTKKHLYFRQLGRSMYSGEKLDYEKLHLYEIDHIIYRSLIKDDSLDNLVLVTKKENQDRSNQIMPGAFVSNEVKMFWKYLKENKLISDSKYNRLMKRELNKSDIEVFINRQLVETRQISKHVTNILTSCYEKDGTKVVAIKSNLVSDFRNQFDIYKNREINDFHHAHDAFIVGVIGSYIQKRFPSLESEFIYKEYRKYKDDAGKKSNKYGFIVGSMNKTFEKEGKQVWVKDESINKIKKQIDYKNYLVTKRVCDNKGQMFNATINGKASKVDKTIPIKANLDVLKYGYRSGESIAYSSIIEYKKGENRIKELVGVPIRYSNNIGKCDKKLKDYFEKVRKFEDVVILKAKVPKYQMFENSGGVFYLASTEEWHNAKQLILDKKSQEIIYKMFKAEQIENVSDDDLVYVYERLIEKIEGQYNIFSGVLNKLVKAKDNFKILNKKDKVKAIKEILNVTKANGRIGNLKSIKELKDVKFSEAEGRLNARKIKIEDTTFIYQSVTGLFYTKKKY